VETKEVVIIRRCIDAGIGDAPPGSGGRTFEHRRLYRVGETISDLSADDAERLVRSGVAKLMP
jgi:hypothetical protein